ncbi:MAG: hypothetical protein AB8B85_07530 [Paracoccaceae bacterium]
MTDVPKDWVPDKPEPIETTGFPKPSRRMEFLDEPPWNRPCAASDPPALTYPHSQQKKRQDHMLVDSRMMLVNSRFTGLMHAFDLGTAEDPGTRHRRVGFCPAPLFEADKESPVADGIFKDVSVRKSEMGADKCSEALGDNPPFIARSGTKDGRIVMPRATLDEPDSWRGEAVMNCIFASNRTKRPMKDAKIEPVGFVACNIVEET